ncbi:hypothetical protein Csa_015494, partial [Cucumis sativus]
YPAQSQSCDPVGYTYQSNTLRDVHFSLVFCRNTYQSNAPEGCIIIGDPVGHLQGTHPNKN